MNDIQSSKNLNEFIILNPFFAKNYSLDYCEFIKKINDLIFTEKCRYITQTLNLLKNSNYNLKEFKNYNIEYYRIINLVIINIFNNKFRQFLNIPIKKNWRIS